jgi:hypothetical protein
MIPRSSFPFLSNEVALRRAIKDLKSQHLYRGDNVWYIKEEVKCLGKRRKTLVKENEMQEENRRIRYLRFLVDFSILSIQQDDLISKRRGTENVKRGFSLFPGKEETFELIYRPRFNRTIHERFGLLSEWSL